MVEASLTNTPGFGAASLYMALGGAVSSMFGSYYSAQSQKINLESQAKIAEINARVAELGAQSALNQGQHQVASLTMQAGNLKSRQRASMAANGIDLGVGNAAEIQASTDIMKEIDKNTATANAVRNAFGYRAQGVNYQNEALIKRSTAQSISPFGSAATSLLGSAGKVATAWYGYNKDQELAAANKTDDPIFSYGQGRGWGW